MVTREKVSPTTTTTADGKVVPEVDISTYFTPTASELDAEARTTANDGVVAIDKPIDGTLWLCEQYPITRTDLNTVQNTHARAHTHTLMQRTSS